MPDDDLTLEQAFSDQPEEQSEEQSEATGDESAETTETEEVSRETSEDGPEAEGDEAATPAEQKKDADDAWHVKAVKSEREKRQAAERKLAELEKAQQQGEPPPKTSFYDDEDKAFEERLRERELQWSSRFLELSREIAVDKHGEEAVERAYQTYLERAEKDPSLAQRVADSSNGFRIIMDQVDRWEKESKLDSFDDEIAKARAEAKEEARRELEAELKAKAGKRADLTPSLASARSAGSSIESDPEPKNLTVEDVYPE